MSTPSRTDVPFHAIWPFLILSFGIVYAITGAWMLWPARMEAIFGPLSIFNPLFMIMVWSPALSAWAVILATTGWSGFKGYLSRLLVLRARLIWWLLLLIGLPAVFYAGALIKGEPFRLWPFDSAGMALAAFGIMAILGPLEEFGWRDLMQPLMQRKLAPFWAATVIGAVWGLWHLPAFLLSGTPQEHWGFLPFFVGAIAISWMITPLFNEGGGAILMPMLYHFQLNGPAWPDAMPYDVPIWVALSVLIVLLHRKAMFDRSAGVTRVTELEPPRRPAP